MNTNLLVSTRTLLVVIIAAVMLTGCLGVEVETRFNADGSGLLVSKMRVSKSLLEMTGDTDSGFDIPTSKEDIESRFQEQSGVRLIEVTEEETDEDIIITSKVEFDSLSSVVDSTDSPLESGALRTTDEGTVFTMVIGEAKDAMLNSEESPFGEAGLDETMIAMLEGFLEGYEIQYRVTAPSEIQRHTAGDLSDDRMSVTLSMPMVDYFVLAEPFVFEVVW